MKIRFITLLILFIFLSFTVNSVYAASGKISGYVKDGQTGEPLPGANVIIEGTWHNGKIVKLRTPRGAATDAEGFYYIINLQPGIYAVKAVMMGYESKEITGVKVDFGRTITLNFSLQPTTIQGKEVTVTAKKEVVKLDVSSSEIILSKAETENLAVNDVQEILNLTPGVSVNTYNNKINIRGGGSDQVMAFLDGFSLKDNVFNVPFLSYNRTAIEEISVQTGGFLAEYGDLRSGIINVVTTEGGQNYSVSVDARYSAPGYKYTGPKRYIEDKYYLIYGSDISMDSVRLAQMFPLPEDKFIGWPKFAEKMLTDDDSTNDMSANQRRELWRWRHRGRPEGQLPDYIIDGTVSGPMPGRSLPGVGKLFSKMNFMVSHRYKYDAYAHPAYRDHFRERNTMFKLNYHISQSMRLTTLGMFADEWGTANTNQERGDDAYVMRSGGGGTYGDCVYPIGDIKTTNWGFNFVHTLSPKTFYEIRVSRMDRSYNFRHGPVRDTTKVKFINPEYYAIQSDSLRVPGFWDAATGHYVSKDTILYRGDQLWFPGSAYDETPEGWVIPGRAIYDQVGKVNLNASAGDRDRSSGWSFVVRGDLTSQVNKYHQIKTGFYFNQNRINRDWYQIRTPVEDRAIRYSEKPRYGAIYFQDRVEIRGLIGNFGLRGEYFDANTKNYEPGDPFSDYYFIPNMWTNLDSMDWEPSKKYFRLSPRLGISHPMTASSKIYFNYGHAYNSPNNTYRYGFLPHPYMTAPIEWRGNPNLKPQKTVQYELGYEQVLLDEYLIHTAIYYKDVTDELGWVYYQNVFSPDPTRRYRTWDNKAYEDIIGWEFRLYKRVGRFMTGWIQTEFRGQKRGEIGFENRYVEGDPFNVSTYSKYSYPDEVLWDWLPSFLANVDLHTPMDWGPTIMGKKLLGGWRVNAILSWAEGAKFTWNPTNNPFIRNNLQYANSFSNDYFISKTIHIGSLPAIIYCDVHNLFNRKLLNVGVLNGLAENPGSEKYQYFASLRKGDRVGHYKAKHIVRPKEKPGENYIYRVGGPIKVFFGIRFNFDFK